MTNSSQTKPYHHSRSQQFSKIATELTSYFDEKFMIILSLKACNICSNFEFSLKYLIALLEILMTKSFDKINIKSYGNSTSIRTATLKKTEMNKMNKKSFDSFTHPPTQA